MKFENCKDAFRVDGSLRDIYVQDTTLSDWDKFLQFVLGLSSEYFCDSEPFPLPMNVQEIFDDTEHSRVLSINLNGPIACCHFFCIDEIELDICPKEVLSQKDLDHLLAFIGGLGACLNKDVILTEEDSPESVWIRFDCEAAEIIFTAPE